MGLDYAGAEEFTTKDVNLVLPDYILKCLFPAARKPQRVSEGKTITIRTYKPFPSNERRVEARHIKYPLPLFYRIFAFP